jgi:6-phospho-3-hexuloisomerase
MRLMHQGLNVHLAGDSTTPAIASGDLLLWWPPAREPPPAWSRRQKLQPRPGRGLPCSPPTRTPRSPASPTQWSSSPPPRRPTTAPAFRRQYAGSLFERSLFVVSEAIFQSHWDNDVQLAEELWLRHPTSGIYVPLSTSRPATLLRPGNRKDKP